jgi:copper/silver efflux system protein
VAGNNLLEIDQVTQHIAQTAKTIDGVASAIAEQLNGGRYVDIQLDRAALARYGLSITQAQSVVSSLIGGDNIGEVVDGRARFPINVRYPREWRDSLEKLRNLPIITPLGSQITLGTVATIAINDGPTMLKSENARPTGWVYIDVRGRDLASSVASLREAVSSQVQLPAGVSLSYSGQFEFMERANARLQWVVPSIVLAVCAMCCVT